VAPADDWGPIIRKHSSIPRQLISLDPSGAIAIEDHRKHSFPASRIEKSDE
jgi:hypothetical protein